MTDRLVSLAQALVFISIGLALCAVIFAIAGYPAATMFQSIFEGAFLRNGALTHVLRWGLPLFITAVGVAVSFRAGYYNIGAQGQFYIGAICAAFVAEWLRGAPASIVIPACFLAGMTGGALWALWPGILRLRSGADEVITTLMGNFLASILLIHVTSGPLKDPSGSGQQASSRPIEAAYRISTSQACHRRSLPLPCLLASRSGCWSTERHSVCCRGSPDVTNHGHLAGCTDVENRPRQFRRQRRFGRPCRHH